MANSDPSPTITPLYLRDRDVAALASVSRSLVWRLTSEGLLPKPIRIPSTRSSRWRRDEVIAAIESWGATK